MADAAVGSARHRAGHRAADQRAAHLHHLLPRQGRPRHPRHLHTHRRTAILV